MAGMYDIVTHPSRKQRNMAAGSIGHTSKVHSYKVSQKVTEMLMSSNPEMKQLGEVMKEEEILKQKLGLHVIKELQEKHPELILTGSAALYLHSIRLKRWDFELKDVDVDFITPYSVTLQECELHHRNESTGYRDRWTKKDHATMYSNFRKIEVAVDPYQRYQFIELDDFKYKVSPLQDIWWWKLKYSRDGNSKHEQDLQEAMGVNPARNIEHERLQQAELERLERQRREWSRGS